MPVPLSVYCSTKLYPKHIQYTDIYSSSVPNAKRNLFTELVLSHCPCTLLSTECQTSVGEHSPGQQKALPARRDYTYCLLATGSACSREQGTASVHAQLSVHPCSSGSEHQHIVKSCGFFFLFFFLHSLIQNSVYVGKEVVAFSGWMNCKPWGITWSNSNE